MAEPYDDFAPIPSKPQGPKASGGVSQKDRRFSDTFFDTHKHPIRFPRGRPFTGEREYAANPDQGHEPGFISSNLQCGEFFADDLGNVDRPATLRSAWHCPWLAPEKYWRFDYKRKIIRFDYQRMITDESQALERYYQAAADLGIQLNVRVEWDVLPHPQIVAKLGRPTQMHIVAEAAMAGDPWLLGFHDEPNPQLATILNVTQAGLRKRTSYIPPTAVPQAQAVDAILAAPPNTDLMQMLAQMAQAVTTLTERVDALATKKNGKNAPVEDDAVAEREAFLKREEASKKMRAAKAKQQAEDAGRVYVEGSEPVGVE